MERGAGGSQGSTWASKSEERAEEVGGDRADCGEQTEPLDTWLSPSLWADSQKWKVGMGAG